MGIGVPEDGECGGRTESLEWSCKVGPLPFLQELSLFSGVLFPTKVSLWVKIWALSASLFPRDAFRIHSGLEEGVSSRASILEEKMGSKDPSLRGHISCLLLIKQINT